jgi:hypothetical protein
MIKFEEFLVEKPIKDWSIEEMNYIFTQIEFYSEILLKKNLYYKKEKRKLIQPLVDRIYNEFFISFGDKVIVTIEKDEYDFICNWVIKDYIPYKLKTDAGFIGGDIAVAEDRTINGTCGNLAALKPFGGGMKDIDFTIGPSRKYNVPDLKKFFGADIGVKTGRLGRAANLPLVLNYLKFTKEYKNSDKNKYKKVESQIFTCQDGDDPLKYCIIGIAKPRDIINGIHRAFTLDPKAMANDKPGGAKGGFFALHDTVFCRTKEEVKNLLKGQEFQAISYRNI